METARGDLGHAFQQQQAEDPPIAFSASKNGQSSPKIATWKQSQANSAVFEQKVEKSSAAIQPNQQSAI
jgi:hypothetical protein